MQTYETTFVIDSLQKTEEMQATVGKIETFINNHGGSIVKKDEWGKKRLAYEINRKQYGTYIHLLFQAPGSMPALLEREYKLEESILRYLTVTADGHAVKKLEEEAAQQPEVEAETPQPQSEPVAATAESPVTTEAAKSMTEGGVEETAAEAETSDEPSEIKQESAAKE